MEIIKSEFIEKFPEISSAIKEADVIAIDAEFTGLTTPEIHLRSDDDLQSRYNKVRKCVGQFTIVQYGVCAFKKTTDGYVAKPFNFYVFGEEDPTRPFGRYFLSSSSSLAFLRSNHFDFNKLVDDGIPFYNFGYSESTETIRSADKELHEEYKSKIDDWLQNGQNKPLVLQTGTRSHKKILHALMREPAYNGFLRLHTRDSTSAEVQRLSEEERRRRMESTQPSDLNFRRVIELIRDAGCPVIAHNAVFDICHTAHQFWRPLPQEVEDFKVLVSDMWKNIVDTKYMAEFHPQLKRCFTSSVLGPLYDTVDKEIQNGGPIITIAQGYDRYTTKRGPVCHEAGYDAYMTGVIYLGFIHYIREREEAEKPSAVEETNDIAATPAQKDYDILLPDYSNRLFLMRCDIPYIDLKSTDLVAPRPQNRLFLDHIPEGLTNDGIELLFPELQPFSVSWASPTNAWIIAKHKNKFEAPTLGKFGKQRLTEFLLNGSRHEEALKLKITSTAENLELLSFDRWKQLYQSTNNASTHNTQVDGQTETIPNGGFSYDDIGIPVAPSFTSTGVKRRRDKGDDGKKPSKKMHHLPTE